MQIRGVSYKPSDISDGQAPHSIAILRANNISNDGNIETSDLVWIREERIKSEQFLRDGDILLCASSGSKGLVGKAAQVNGVCGMSFGAFCKVIRPTIANKKYLGFYFQSPQYRHSISEASAGININNIRAEDLDHLEIELPDEVEQGRRCFILDKAVKAIRLRKQQIEKLNDLVKSQFIEMFGGCSLRNRQTDWVKIGTVAEVVGGSTPKTDKKEYWDGEYYWITPAEISEDDFVVYKTQRTLTELGVRSSSLRRLPTGTILLSSRAPIGKVAIAGVEMYCNQGFKNLVCGKELNPIYGYALLKYNTEYLNSLGRGATFKEISKAIVENIYIPVPPIERQNDFARFVEQTDKSKFRIKQSLEKLETLYKALLQKYFG